MHLITVTDDNNEDDNDFHDDFYIFSLSFAFFLHNIPLLLLLWFFCLPYYRLLKRQHFIFAWIFTDYTEFCTVKWNWIIMLDVIDCKCLPFSDRTSWIPFDQCSFGIVEKKIVNFRVCWRRTQEMTMQLKGLLWNIKPPYAHTLKKKAFYFSHFIFSAPPYKCRLYYWLHC